MRELLIVSVLLLGGLVLGWIVGRFINALGR